MLLPSEFSRSFYNSELKSRGIQVLPSCNRQPRMSSAFRGVRSRPPEEETRTSSKTETIPLLSPTMESELLKESWFTPKMKPNSIVDGEDNSQNFSVWEENFQDLSGWCIDQFPEQCDFPIGEAIDSKLSETRYENDVSTLEGVSDGFTVVYDEKTNCNGDILHMADLSNLQPVEKFEQLESSYTAANKPNVWLNATTPVTNTITSTATSTINSNVSGRLRSGNLKLRIPQQVTQTKPLDPLEPAILSTLVTNEPESFDLLSYLCDDEVPLPSASTSKTLDSKLKVNREPKTPTIQNQEMKLRERRTESTKKRTELREPNRISSSSSASSSSSTYLEESTKLSERIEKSKHSSAKLMKDYCKGRRRGVKRMLESDSEDQDHSDHSNYRESREKNNEASRKSRMNKKAKEMEMAKRAVQLEKDNRVLKMKVEELEKLVTSMRMALLQSALKKER